MDAEEGNSERSSGGDGKNTDTQSSNDPSQYDVVVSATRQSSAVSTIDKLVDDLLTITAVPGSNVSLSRISLAKQQEEDELVHAAQQDARRCKKCRRLQCTCGRLKGGKMHHHHHHVKHPRVDPALVASRIVEEPCGFNKWTEYLMRMFEQYGIERPKVKVEFNGLSVTTLVRQCKNSDCSSPLFRPTTWPAIWSCLSECSADTCIPCVHDDSARLTRTCIAAAGSDRFCWCVHCW